MRVSRKVQDDLHADICAGDPTGSARLFELLLEPLIEGLNFQWPREQDAERVRDFAVDSIVNYVEKPCKYNPSKASLLTYLRMDAHRDLLNDYERRKRERNRREDSDVELANLLRNSSTDEYPSDRDPPDMKLSEVREALPDERDRRAILLLIEGERTTEAFAKVWDLAGLPRDARFAEVKRNKDRIKARLRRLRQT